MTWSEKAHPDRYSRAIMEILETSIVPLTANQIRAIMQLNGDLEPEMVARKGRLVTDRLQGLYHSGNHPPLKRVKREQAWAYYLNGRPEETHGTQDR